MRATPVATLLLLLACALLATSAWAQGQGRGHGQNHAPGQNKDKGGVNIEKCKGFGRDAGQKAAQVACDLSQTYCRGNQRNFGGPPKRTFVDLQQCGNAAYGVCQDIGMNSSPCSSAFRGFQACGESQWREFYTGTLNAECNQAVAVFDNAQGK